eukprot:5612754-Pyramimonas_sp.AAC.1
MFEAQGCDIARAALMCIGSRCIAATIRPSAGRCEGFQEFSRGELSPLRVVFATGLRAVRRAA